MRITRIREDSSYIAESSMMEEERRRSQRKARRSGFSGSEPPALVQALVLDGIHGLLQHHLTLHIGFLECCVDTFLSIVVIARKNLIDLYCEIIVI